MTSFAIDKKSHKDASKQAKIRNMTKSSNPNEVAVAKRKLKSKIELPPNPQIEGLRIVDLIITEIEEAHMNKTCGKGEYYCYTDKKCKKIPKGSHMNSKGRLVPDNDDNDDQEDGGDQAIDPGGMGENVVLHTADGKKFAEIIDLIRPEDVMPKMKAADQWVNEEDSYAQAKKELKATKSARDHRHNTIHKSTNTKGNVDVNENLDDKRRANVQKQKQQSAQTVASAQKSQDSVRQTFARRAQAVAKAKQKAKDRENLSREIDRKVAAATQSEEAVSKKQQRFMGAVLHAKRTGEASTPEVAKAAGSMKTKDVKDFASTKHKGLPEKKTKKEELQMTVDEAVRLPSEFGNIVMVGVNWRGKMYNLKMFFPQAKMPTRSDVQDEIVKVYPGGRVQWFDKYELASQEAQWDNDSNPIIKVTKEELEIEESNCKCNCGKVPCIKCGGDHHKKEKSEKQKAKERKGSVSARKNITASQLRKYDTDGDGKVRVVNASYDHEEVKEAKAKYDNTKSPDYEKKKAALAKKHGGYDKIKGHPQYENKSLKGFMDEGKIADAMRANLERLKASDERSQKNLEKFLKDTKKVRDDEKKAQDSA
tara:strand:+ start:148 stop:1926 length:1779 start_codon:yes stop_codon:yes gene_type:complete